MTAPTTVEEIPTPSGFPSSSKAHEDITTSPHRQRAPAPSLPLDAFTPLLRSFSAAPSVSGTPSSRYLSPPISIGSVGSPPPRLEADDYLAAGARHARGKGKHQTRREYRIHSPLVMSEDSQIEVVPSNVTPPPASFVEATRPELASTADSNDDGIELPPPPACLITVLPKKRHRGWQLRDSIECLPPEVKATILPAPLDVSDGATSPAVNALRRLSRTRTQTRDTGFGEIDRFSRALTGTLGRVFTFKNGPPAVSMVNETTGLLAATGAHSADSEYGTGHHNHVTFKEDGVSEVRATPAIITLRKATVAPLLRSTTKPNTTLESSEACSSFESPFQKWTSTENLEAFGSKHIEKAWPLISSTVASLKENGHASPPLDPAVRRLSLASDFLSPRQKTRSMSLLGNTAVNRRHSVAAEAAQATLTTAEFFPCPGILISPCSKLSLLSTEQASVRTSVVRFASQNSVHNIIWQANESSSSGGSISPVSPTSRESPSSKDDSSPPKKPSEYIDQDPFATLNAEIQTALDDAPSSPLGKSVLQLPAEREAEDVFSAWSWESSPAPVMESHVSLHGDHRRKSTFLRGKASTFDDLAVVSFPTLHDRRSMSESHKKSMVDLHVAGADGEEPHFHGVSEREEGAGQRSRASSTVLQSDTEAETGSKTEKERRSSSSVGRD
ncbi:hypothetical protein MMC29_003822 [Sticta canariensis]|nr:hypothetical protein [Sticta canariensis]